MTVTVTLISDMLRVEFDGVLHLTIYYPILFAVQSWVENDSRFCIRYYTKDGNVDSLYHDREVWLQVLGGVNKFV